MHILRISHNAHFGIGNSLSYKPHEQPILLKLIEKKGFTSDTKVTKMRILILLSLIFTICRSYKVLVFNPAMVGSHSNFLGKISDILIDAGHEVTMLIPVLMHEKRDLLLVRKKLRILSELSKIPEFFKCNKKQLQTR
ncbi:Protein CBG26745 [Caenorhabditis briggsae]|uniref:Protein CBG26745 n=1 Tax=Caenorhabditis briggsae TaxID=6238 RepID=B6IEC0_CAEBR|nr:Protein CBG26745 [Caenorhabditis briggsae]CAS01184.1 Protein CBG26745 [Caenorhabditis briggsae]